MYQLVATTQSYNTTTYNLEINHVVKQAQRGYVGSNKSSEVEHALQFLNNVVLDDDDDDDDEYETNLAMSLN